MEMIMIIPDHTVAGTNFKHFEISIKRRQVLRNKEISRTNCRTTIRI